MGALGPGEGHGPGAEFRGELPLDLPGAVAEPRGEPGDALAVHDAVGDEPHGPADDVRADVPLRGARHGVRPAPPAGPEAGALRGGGRREEAHVVPFRCHGRAAGAAVDAGGPDGEEEHSVEPAVPAPHRLVPAVLVLHAFQCGPGKRDGPAEIGRGGDGCRSDAAGGAGRAEPTGAGRTQPTDAGRTQLTDAGRTQPAGAARTQPTDARRTQLTGAGRTVLADAERTQLTEADRRQLAGARSGGAGRCRAGEPVRPVVRGRGPRGRSGGPGAAAPGRPRRYRRPYVHGPRLARIAALPSAPFRFQSRRSSARTRASVLATIHWFSRMSLR